MTLRTFFLAFITASVPACGEVTTGGNEGPSPTIETIDPVAGTSAGGTEVTITGSGFLDSGAGDASIVVGDLAATNVAVVDDSTLTFTTPPGTPGDLVGITVFNENGFGDSVDPFLYNELPRVTLVSPAVGPAVGGTTVTITGLGFEAIDNGTTTVMVGAAAATNITIVSDTEITAETGALADTAFSALDVNVINNNGTATLPATYQYTQQGLLGTVRQFGNGQGITTLFFVNPTTLEVAEVAELPVKMSNFAYDTGGQLFGTSTQNTTLFRIDTETFAVENIGSVTNATMGQRRVVELAFIGTTLFGFDRNERRLFSFDLATGVGTTIGATALLQGPGTCLRLRDGGSFFMIQNLDSNVQFLNASNSVATTGPAMNGPANVRCHGIADFNGDVFVSTARNQPGGQDSGRLFTIDLATGILTEVGELPFNFTSLFPTPDSF